MKHLHAALRQAQGKRAVLYCVTAIAVILLAGLAAMGESWQPTVLLLTGIACAAAAAAILFFCRSAWACRRMLNRLLRGAPFAQAFRSTAEEELSRAGKPAFYSRAYRLHLYLTEHWFILVSTNCSLIRPRESFVGAERVLLENEYEHAARLRFDDGSVICRCEHICDALIEAITQQNRGGDPI